MGIDIGKAIKDAIFAMVNDTNLFIIVLIQAFLVSVISYFIVNSLFGNIAAMASNPGHLLSSFLSLAPVLIVVWIITLLISLLFDIAIVSKAYYGKKMSIRGAFENAVSRFLPTFALLILLGLIFGVPYIIIELLAIAVSPIFFIFFLIYAILAVYVAGYVAIALPFAVVGKKGPVDSLRMSWNAIKGNWWHVFLAFLILFIIYYVIVLIVEIPIFIQIFSPVIATMHNYSAAYNSVNASQINSSAMTTSILKSEASAFRSPYSYVASAITEIISAWLIILSVMIYMQLVDMKMKDAVAKTKAKK